MACLGAKERLGSHLQILCADGRHICYAQDEADGVQDVGLSTAVEASDGIEALVPVCLSATAS